MAKPRHIKNDILRLRRDGKNYNEIAEILECSKGTVGFHCKRHGLTDMGQKNNKVSDAVISEIREFCKHNKVDDAVIHFNLSRSTIKKYKEKKRSMTA